MATQVEALLPNNPLLNPEDRGHAGQIKHGDDRLEKGQKQTGVSDDLSTVKGTDAELGGCTTKEKSLKLAKGESNNQGKENLPQDSQSDSSEGGKNNQKEFTEAPPPKVNPWTKKMNAVTVVSVNGQAHQGLLFPLVTFSISMCI